MESEDWVVVTPNSGMTDFVGYDQLTAPVRISRYRKVTIRDKQVYHLVFDQTPFYAEGGGQVGDIGLLHYNGGKVNITNTFKEHGLVIHVTDKLPPDISVIFKASVFPGSRSDTARNHTATHLLHFALREVLGKHVEQKGSLVTADYLRFDFSHFQKMTDDEISAVESRVNRNITEGILRHEMRAVPMEDAKKIGAMALFGEKYGDAVRVIQFGSSVELCGGTHVEVTSQIGLFKIVSEGSIATGIRRIEAITGEKALTWYQEKEKILRQIEEILNNPQSILKAVSSLVDEKNALQKELDKYAKEHTAMFKTTLLGKLQKIGDIQLIATRADEKVDNAGIIREVAFQLRNEIDGLILVIGAVLSDKPHLAVMISDKLVREKKLHAGEIVKKAAEEFNGGGGGQPFFATAGGKDPGKLDMAIEKATQMILTS